MFEDEKRELFELVMKVRKETNAYISFEFSTRTVAHICIKDNGYNSQKGYDGKYDMYECESFVEGAREQYDKAKEYFLRLIEKGGHPA